MPLDQQELYTPEQTATLLRMSKCNLWRIVRAGKIKRQQLSERKIVFTRQSIDDYLSLVNGVAA
jgi:hypothetical protein